VRPGWTRTWASVGGDHWMATIVSTTEIDFPRRAISL
jgi:hypothetical protein